MVDWSQLFVPILLSAVLVFVASSVIHMALKYHNAEHRPLPNEDEVRAAIRKGSSGPGQYMFPHCTDHKDAAGPAMQQKFIEGPVGSLILRTPGPIKLGPFLGAWTVYTLVISALAAYVAHSTLRFGASHREVFRLVGAATWLAYAWQSPADSIWKGKPWSATIKDLFDGLVYAALTAGAFAWLWPR